MFHKQKAETKTRRKRNLIQYQRKFIFLSAKPLRLDLIKVVRAKKRFSPLHQKEFSGVILLVPL